MLCINKFLVKNIIIIIIKKISVGDIDKWIMHGKTNPVICAVEAIFKVTGVTNNHPHNQIQS